MLQESIDESSLSGFNHLSSGASGSSKDLLDAAEETIEELLIEAQMWESHYQKLKIDLEKLQKESDEKSKNQTEILLELSASQAEQESLRQEIEELKLSLKVATERQTVGGISKSGDAIDVQFELKDEVHFLRESNENLTMQLKKSQDANIELVSILQELEETIEAQRTTISNFTQMSNMIDQDIPTNALSAQEDAEWERKMSLKEDEIIALREKLDRVLSIENPGGVGSDAIYLELEKENDFLKVKMQDLENDCSELTEENLELIHKLKEVSGVEEQDSCLSDIEGNNDLATDNRGCCLVNEEPDLQVKVQSLESGLAEVLEKNSMYMTQVKR
ncbi:Myosin heavy chain-related protein [Zea mays]|uniref:Myosin heavy chain-related protein n=1 Tax=Zea mays TaxID=4577 RepID=A0A1D6P7E1_MAIZE|nr:Myosin heavy chain-related protein [Zea mays]